MMRNYLAALKHGFSGLLKFSGRDDSVLFWSYATTIIFVGIVVTMVGTIPTMMESMAKMQEFAIQNPDQTTIRQGPGSYSISVEGNHPGFMPDIRGLSAFVATISLVVAGLLAAAVCRRLHDTGIRGYWGLIPVPFLISWTVVGPMAFESMGSTKGPEISTVLLLMLNNILYLGSLGLLMFLLLRNSASDLANQNAEQTDDDKQPRPARRRQ